MKQVSLNANLRQCSYDTSLYHSFSKDSFSFSDLELTLHSDFRWSTCYVIYIFIDVKQCKREIIRLISDRYLIQRSGLRQGNDCVTAADTPQDSLQRQRSFHCSKLAET